MGFRWRWLLVVACWLVALAGCSGGVHRRGQHQVQLTGSIGAPIKGDVVWPDGKGQADNGAVTVGYNYFFRDRWAFLTAVTPYRNYNQGEGDASAAEFQIGFRYYFAEFDVAEWPVALYAEALGGLLYADRSVPEGGSHGNFTQDTGVGFEVHLAENVQWLTGYRLRHLSNGRLFRSDSNPSQNDHLVYTGLAISWE